LCTARREFIPILSFSLLAPHQIRSRSPPPNHARRRRAVSRKHVGASVAGCSSRVDSWSARRRRSRGLGVARRSEVSG
jgi:hypothetical protein